ncbi:MAG: DUF4130 domain-containing protein [Promethearchaeota archaeon]
MFRKITRKQVLDSLSRHKNATTELLENVKLIPKEILENIGTDVAKRAVAMSQEVDRDLHSHKAFLRLSASPYGILYAKSDRMKHYNEEHLIKFFHTRFPTFIILFESKRGTFSINQDSIIENSTKSLDEALQEYEKKLPINPLFINSDEREYLELWESFAHSQIIRGRRTSKQLISLSKRWGGTVAKDKTESKKLDEFFE